jgi:hypothetical protein
VPAAPRLSSLPPSSWPGLTRPSRVAGHGIRVLPPWMAAQGRP